jgi:GH15 family glucan-1,4-alpha-glucosidase
MKIRSVVALVGLTIFAVPTFAQQANDVVGAWTLVSITLEQDGKKTDFYGPNPQGQLMYDANGRLSVIITRSDLPKFASNNRETGTAEENKAIVQGTIAYFGTYTVSETDKTISYHIESSTFPNWNGADRKASFNISGDELSIHVISGPLTSIGTGTAYAVWKRAK